MHHDHASRKVHIVDYDPLWPRLFEAERDALRALPFNPLIDLEHFGSTAVPALRAKPVIDIMASVVRLDDADRFAPQLLSIGYRQIDVGFRKRHFLAKVVDGQETAFHLHLIASAAWANKSERLFRDRLIAHPHLAAAYAELKTELAERFATDSRAYTEAKTAFIQAAVNDARRARGLPPENVWEE